MSGTLSLHDIEFSMTLCKRFKKWTLNQPCQEKTTYSVDTTVFDVKSYFLDAWGVLHQAKPDGLAFFMLSCLDNTYPTLLTIIDYPKFGISITFAQKAFPFLHL